MDLFSILPNCQIKLKKWVKTLQTMEKDIAVIGIYIQSKKRDYIWKKLWICWCSELRNRRSFGVEKENVLCKKEKKSIFWKMLTSMMRLTLSTIHTCKFFCLQCLRVALVLFYLLFSMLIFTAYYSQIFFS